MARQRQRKGDPVHGWLNLFKPLDMTSTQAVGVVKRVFNAQKVGHGGTLDPLADGVLPIALGEATKTVAYAMDAAKTYEFTVNWGVSTTSQDGEGEIVATSGVRPPADAITAVLGRFIGEITQVPPKFSAIKVDGERAYDLAREGEEFALEGRAVRVDDFRLDSVVDADHARFTVDCGKGFYIRALVRDLAQALGAEGHVSQLRRTRVGAMRAGDAISLEKLESVAHKDDLSALLLPVETTLDDIPVLAIGGEDAFRLRQGREIVLLPHLVEAWRNQRADLAPEGDDALRTALATYGGQAVALGEVRAGRFQPVRVFLM
jgi:tRNA pseudouridine55 synthase